MFHAYPTTMTVAACGILLGLSLSTNAAEKKTAAVAVAPVVSTAERTPSESSRTVSIEELVDDTLRNNPELAFYEAEIAAARGERRQAGAWQNPEFSTEIGRKRVQGDMAAEGTVWALSAAQTFEWPGRVSLRKAIANQQIQLAQLGLEQFRTALAGQVRQKAYAVFAAQRRAAAAQEVATRGEELVATLVQREPAGITPLLETRAIEASVIKLKREVVEASKDAKSSLFELNQLRGRPVGETLIIAEPTLSFPEVPSAGELIRQAARGNFQLKQREVELTQQGFRVRLAENEVWPSITVGPQISQEKAGNERESQVSIGVSLPLPLWNRNQGNIQTAKARQLQAEATLRVQQREVERRIREQLATYEVNRRELTRLNPQVVEQLREAAVLADRHYRLGAVPLATYLEVQESYLEALEAIYATQADALTATTEIQVLTGGSLTNTKP